MIKYEDDKMLEERRQLQEEMIPMEEIEQYIISQYNARYVSSSPQFTAYLAKAEYLEAGDTEALIHLGGACVQILLESKVTAAEEEKALSIMSMARFGGLIKFEGRYYVRHTIHQRCFTKDLFDNSIALTVRSWGYLESELELKDED